MKNRKFTFRLEKPFYDILENECTNDLCTENVSALIREILKEHCRNKLIEEGVQVIPSYLQPIDLSLHKKQIEKEEQILKDLKNIK